MYLEEEVYYLLVLAFALVMVLSSAILIWRYVKTRNKHLVWFGGQVLFLIAAFCFFYQCVCNTPDLSFIMYSEEQSVTLTLAGICWAISMLFESVGVWKAVKVKK